MTFAHVAPTPKTEGGSGGGGGGNRYSFTGEGEGVMVGGGEQPDPAQYRRYLALEVPPDHPHHPHHHHPYHHPMDDGSGYPPQGVVIGMTHLPPSSSSPSTPTPTTVLPAQEGYPVKYPGQWQKGVMEDPNLVYSAYTSSLPRPTPFLGLSKPFQAESKYLKSMQALKVMDEEIMKEGTTS